ncbi:MAG: phosphatase PAP2 family protein [Streptomycetaceae bacterium]|nr:phosphatase PAP2 family protein [Streptomycetaceae bacterium]
MADGIAEESARKRRVDWRYWGDAAKELLLIAAIFGVYKLGRGLVTGQESVAFRNARELLRIQTDLRMPDAAAFQHWVAQSHAAIEFCNKYYLYVHWPATVGFLLWLWIWHRERYAWIRNILSVMTLVALVIAIVIPMAPPRLMPSYGFVDTGMIFGDSPYSGTGAKISNQYAAMPSLHFGWAVVVALGTWAVWRHADRKRRVVAHLIWLHPALTLFVIVVTANHYWLDAVVALVLLAFALFIVPAKAPHARLVKMIPPVFIPRQRRASLKGETAAADADDAGRAGQDDAQRADEDDAEPAEPAAR